MGDDQVDHQPGQRPLRVVGVVRGLDRERDGWYREVADAVVPVEPAHDTDHPKRALAGLVVDLVVAHEGAPAPAGDSMEGSVG